MSALSISIMKSFSSQGLIRIPRLIDVVLSSAGDVQTSDQCRIYLPVAEVIDDKHYRHPSQPPHIYTCIYMHKHRYIYGHIACMYTCIVLYICIQMG